jgi:hypothetical protein
MNICPVALELFLAHIQKDFNRNSKGMRASLKIDT